MDAQLASILSLAFGLGLVHALDADHIAAVAGFAGMRGGRTAAIGYAFKWALGHGATLLVIGITAYGLGLAITPTASAVAEHAVGLVLMLIGIGVLWRIRREHLHAHFHAHGGMPAHLHWHAHTHAPDSGAAHRHTHTPVLVGLIHGLAGSAPLLALLPITQQSAKHGAWFGLGWLLLFSAGVLVAMLAFGGVLGMVTSQLARRSERALTGLRALVGIAALGLGGSLLIVGH
jgi:sulfite exporter TauE/SafE